LYVDSESYSPLLDEKELQEGKMKVVRAEGKPVLFIKQNGNVYVIDDRCPHMGCKFSGGSLDGEVVICPCHEWRFNLQSGEYVEDADYVLTTYPFKVVEGKIWVKLEEDL
jgi:3-phenylpropionate/trans-cinnamate dioxygenase ferredoxin subunit